MKNHARQNPVIVRRLIFRSSALGILLAGVAAAATNIHPADKHGWGENIGFLNFRDANGGEDGVRVRATFLKGFIWGENVGWINVGNGQPGDGIHYANDAGDSSTFGVNVDPATGELFGLAWGESIGWINCDTRAALGPNEQQARFDFAAGRFRGYIWGENVGWINLDDSATFVAVVPPACNDPFADADGDGDVDSGDFAIVQRCITGVGVVAPDGCECYDRGEAGFPQGDNDVDSADVDAFDACGSGPTVAPDPACDDG